MTVNKTIRYDSEDLCRLAEDIVREKAVRMPENLETLSPEEARQSVHELRVHQIEMEMQNEELRRAQMELGASQARYFDLYDLAPVGYVTISEQGLILEANLTAAILLGVARADLVKWSLSRFILKEDQDIYYLHHKQLFETGMQQVCEMRVVKKDGSQFWARFEAAAAQDGENGNTLCRAVLSDITERKRVEEALRDSEKRYRELSIVDDLTQLYNSRHFYRQLKMEIDRVDRYGQPLTLLLLDLDDFKWVNDAYGHIEGDQVLMRLGQVVKRCLRQTDSAYRYGGEEFTILLPMTTSADGAVTAERIRTEFRKETFSPVPGQDVHVTVSIGLAQYKPREEMKAFVHRVDQLMYQGKKNGKDSVCSES